MDRRWFVAVAFVALLGLAIMPAAAQAATATGTVKSVDTTSRSFVLTDSAGKDSTVSWDGNTKVTLDGKDATVVDIKAGQKATVTHEGGKASNVALTK